jgi:hypothetical protein
MTKLAKLFEGWWWLVLLVIPLVALIPIYFQHQGVKMERGNAIEQFSKQQTIISNNLSKVQNELNTTSTKRELYYVEKLKPALESYTSNRDSSDRIGNDLVFLYNLSLYNPRSSESVTQQNGESSISQE